MAGGALGNQVRMMRPISTVLYKFLHRAADPHACKWQVKEKLCSIPGYRGVNVKFS